MDQALTFAGYLLVLLAVVPLAGFLVTGSARQAWRYTRQWLQVIGITVAAGLVLAAIVFSLTSI
jgi:hypothetical protein